MTGEPATWAEGDWTGDGLFDQQDIVFSMQSDTYLQDPLAALSVVDSAIADADLVFAQFGRRQ